MESSNLVYPSTTDDTRLRRTGDKTRVMVDYIREFDRMNNLKSGSTYIINGKEVVV